ncbi:MAG: hypothetical protein M1136_12455, partial [Chloroflexi bacterium]|nr:hypothetical protein [Chloroflexota bacterium]
LTYRAPVITDYLIPSYLIFAIWIGVAGGLMLKMVYRGVGLVGRSLSGIVVNYAVSLATGLLAVLLLTFPVHMAIRNWPGLDYSQDRAAERFGMGALQNAKKEAVIMADWEHATILWYYQLVEGLRPDLQVKYVHPEGEIVPWLRRAEGDLARGVVYLTRYDPEIARRYRLRPAGPLVEVCSEPDFQMPAAMKQVGANFANKVKLLGYKLSRSKAEPGGSVHVTLYWQALERMDRSYNVFVHLIDAQKRIWGQRDGVPVKGYYPTNRWVQGEVIADEYELMVLPFTRPGEYALEVGAYETPTPTTWRRLPLLGTDGSSQGDSVQLGTVQVISCDYPLLPAAFPLHRNFGNVVELLGYDLVRKSGDGLSLTTYWRALRPLHTDYRMFIGVDGDASGPADRLGGRYPTSAWVPGELVRERREVRLSSSKATVSHLTLGLIDAMGRDVPLLGGWLIPRDDRLEIAVLSDPTPLRVDFNGQFLLLGYTLSKTRLKPGDSLTVSLRWQALRKIDEDCSIFVHLLDKNGRLVAQDDGVPVYGGFPTTRWVTGHAVTDRHTLRLGAEALPGEYHLQVGVYPSRTEQRLPVLDEELALALQGDRLLLGSVWVGTKPAE